MISINSILTQKIWHCFKLFFIFFVLVCSGCGAKVVHTDINQANVNELLKRFADGTIELETANSRDTNDYRRYREKMKKFYAINDWGSLAKAVIEGNNNDDIDWYYLGRSAEGLKLYQAAKIYYVNGLSTKAKCYRITSPDRGCEEFVFPRDIMVRLNALPSNDYQPTTKKKHKTSPR